MTRAESRALAKYLGAVEAALMADLGTDGHMYVAGYVAGSCKAVGQYVTGERLTYRPLVEVLALETVSVNEYVLKHAGKAEVA